MRSGSATKYNVPFLCKSNYHHPLLSTGSALDLGDLIKSTVQKAIVQKNGKPYCQLVYRNGHTEHKNDLLQLINDKILDSGQPLGSYQLVSFV